MSVLGGSVGVGVWRAVHPYVDRGARLGLRLPDSRRVAMPLGALCPGDQRFTTFPNGSTVFGVLGVSSHFGAAEEFSIGLEYWQHLGVPDGGHYSLGLTFGWELNRGAALPGEYGRRGRASSIAVGVTGAVLWLGGFITLAALSSIG